jgi:hypothetical protein
MVTTGVVKLEVGSPVVRDALLDGCAWVIHFENEKRVQSTQPVNGFDHQNGFDPAQCAQRIVLATTLDEELVAGYPVVDVPVEIADPVARTLVEVIAEEVDALARDKQRRDAILGRTNELLESLVALDDGIVRARERPS